MEGPRPRNPHGEQHSLDGALHLRVCVRPHQSHARIHLYVVVVVAVVAAAAVGLCVCALRVRRRKWM